MPPQASGHTPMASSHPSLRARRPRPATTRRYQPNPTRRVAANKVNEQLYGHPGREERDHEADGKQPRARGVQQMVTLVEFVQGGRDHDRDGGKERVFGGGLAVHSRSSCRQGSSTLSGTFLAKGKGTGTAPRPTPSFHVSESTPSILGRGRKRSTSRIHRAPTASAAATVVGLKRCSLMNLWASSPSSAAGIDVIANRARPRMPERPRFSRNRSNPRNRPGKAAHDGQDRPQLDDDFKRMGSFPRRRDHRNPRVDR